MQIEIGSIYTGKVTGITKFGAFVELEPGKTGMVHISEVANTYVNEIKDHLTEGQEVKVKVLNIAEDGKISLSIKKAMDPPPKREFNRDNRDSGRDRRPPRRENPAPRNANGAPVVLWENRRKSEEPATFEDMLSKFKQNSEEKQCDLKKIIDGKRRSGGPRRGGKN